MKLIWNNFKILKLILFIGPNQFFLYTDTFLRFFRKIKGQARGFIKWNKIHDAGGDDTFYILKKLKKILK